MWALLAPEIRHEAEDLEVEPDERDREREGRIPLHVFRPAFLASAADRFEVEQEIEGGDGTMTRLMTMLSWVPKKSAFVLTPKNESTHVTR